MRIPSAPINSSAALPPPPRISSYGSTFQTVLASASEEGVSKNSLMGSDAKTPAGESEASRKASEQEEAQLPSVPNETGMYTSSPATTTSSLVPPPPAQASPFESTLQMTLASASEQGTFANGMMASCAETPAGPTAPSRAATKQEKAKSPSVDNSVGTHAFAGVSPADQENSSVENMLSWQGNGHWQGDGSAVISAASVAANPSTATRDMPRQLHVSQLVPDTSSAERTATSLKQLNPTAPLVGAVDGESPAQNIPSGMPDFDTGIAAQAAEGIFNVAMGLPMASGLPANEDGSQSVGKATQKGAFDVVGSRNPDLTNATDTGKSTVGGSGDASSSHSAQSNGQPSQNSQTDPSQVAAVAPRGTDNGASQVQAQTQTVVMHVASHDTATTQRTPDGPTDASRPAKQQEVPASIHSDSGEPVVSSGINAAKLIQTMGETEMRVGMHSSEFGDISIRTSISQQQMLAQISLDHSDLSQAISAHVSTVQAKLGAEFGLQASIVVNNHGASLSGGSGNSSQSEQRPFASSARIESAALPVEADIGLSPGALVSAGNEHGLDIRV